MKTFRKFLIFTALIGFAISTTSCATKNITHDKGHHHAYHMSKMQTFYASWFSSKVVLDFKESSWYSPDLISGNPWNKITGRGGFAYNRSEKIRKTEQMLVWRPIQDSLIELAYYWREDYEMFWNVVDTAKIGVPIEVPIRKHLRSFVPTGAYFGGRYPAPQNIHYRLTRKGFRFIW